MKLSKCHCFTSESKVSSCFTVPFFPLRISSKHCEDLSFGKRKDSSTPDFGSSPGARANMDAGLEDQVNEAIEFFPGRVRRDEWARQAGELVRN